MTKFIIRKIRLNYLYFSDKKQRGFIEFTEFIILNCKLNDGKKVDLLLFFFIFVY
jgi:hypothetical protein